MNTIQYVRLNSEAKAYLDSVKQLNGRGAPGIYVKLSYNRPLWGFILGTITIFLTFIFAFCMPPAKGPMAMSLIATAGFLLGGWLLLYAMRRWMASKESFSGKFLYCDPEHVYLGEGENISIAFLGREPEVAPYGENALTFETEEAKFSVPVPNRFVAQFITDYYQALSWAQGRTEGAWVNLSPPEQGALAKHLAEFDEEPSTLADTDLEIDEMPEEVFPEKSGKSGIFMLLLIPIVGFGLFMLFWGLFSPLNDERAFSNAKEDGAHGLRDYLNNDKNTTHVVEAKQMLSQMYDAPILTVTSQAKDPELKKGMIALLESLRGPEIPAVSLRVRETGGVTNENSNLNTRFADGIGQALGGPKKDLIVCVSAPNEDGKKAMIEITYTKTKAVNGVLNWVVEIRTKPDAAPVATKSGSCTPNPVVFPGFPMPGMGMPQSLNGVDEAIYKDIMDRMIGQAPPPAAPLPVDTDDDF